MRLRTISAFLGVFLAIGAGTAGAVPITYLGTLQSGVPVTGTNSQAPGSFDEPATADYWAFSATAGSIIDVIGDRLVGHYDMAFWIFAGTFADTSAFGAFFFPNDPGFIGYFDDQDPGNLPGPFDDPHATFTAPTTGLYTVAVVSNLSAAGPPNPYRLVANVTAAIPEPASLWLMGAGLMLAARRASRRHRFS